MSVRGQCKESAQNLLRHLPGSSCRGTFGLQAGEGRSNQDQMTDCGWKLTFCLWCREGQLFDSEVSGGFMPFTDLRLKSPRPLAESPTWALGAHWLIAGGSRAVRPFDPL